MQGQLFCRLRVKIVRIGLSCSATSNDLIIIACYRLPRQIIQTSSFGSLRKSVLRSTTIMSLPVKINSRRIRSAGLIPSLPEASFSNSLKIATAFPATCVHDKVVRVIRKRRCTHTYQQSNKHQDRNNALHNCIFLSSVTELTSESGILALFIQFNGIIFFLLFLCLKV